MGSTVHHRGPFSLSGKAPRSVERLFKSAAYRSLCVATAQKRLHLTSLAGVPTKVDLHVCHVTEMRTRSVILSSVEITVRSGFSAEIACVRNFRPLCLDPSFHSETFSAPCSHSTETLIPVLRGALRFCDQFPCGLCFFSLQSPHRFYLGDVPDESVVQRHLDDDWCPYCRLQSYAVPVAHERPAPPLGV